MLTPYAQELRAGFFPYVREVASVLGELVSFEYMEDVRIAAGQALPELVRSAALAHEQDAAGATSELVQQLLHFALEKLTVQMADDPDVPVRAPRERAPRRLSHSLARRAASSARSLSAPLLTPPRLASPRGARAPRVRTDVRRAD